MLSNNIDRTPEGVLTFAGYDVTKLAKEYGTPPLPDGRGAHPGQLPDVSAGVP